MASGLIGLRILKEPLIKSSMSHVGLDQRFLKRALIEMSHSMAIIRNLFKPRGIKHAHPQGILVEMHGTC